MRSLFLLLVFLTSTVFADISNFCSGIPTQVWDDWTYVIENKDTLQLALHARVNTGQVTEFLDAYDNANYQLGVPDISGIFPVKELAAVCYAGVSSSFAEFYRQNSCPKINTRDVNFTVELALTAKAIINLTSSSGSEPAVITRVKNSQLDNSFSDTIGRLYSACGDLLSTDIPTVPIIEEPTEPEVPGICSASPYSLMTDFLWKPVSDSDGRLVVLTNPTATINVQGEGLSDRGATNGRCTTARASQSGCSYGKNVLVSISTLREFLIIEIPNGCNRYDCKGSLSNCGIKTYDIQFLSGLTKKIRRLKKKIQNTTSTKAKRRLKKKKRALVRIKKFAASQGAI